MSSHLEPAGDHAVDHVHFPTVFPLHCVTESIAIFTGGQLIDRRAEFAEHLWNIVGFGLATGLAVPLISEGPDVNAIGAEGVSAVNQYGTILDAHKDEITGVYSVPATAGANESAESNELTEALINPATIAILIELAMKIVEWFRRRNPA